LTAIINKRTIQHMMQTFINSLQPKQLANLGAAAYWSLFSSTMINSDREPGGSS
jgi:hypothetical protein